MPEPRHEPDPLVATLLAQLAAVVRQRFWERLATLFVVLVIGIGSLVGAAALQDSINKRSVVIDTTLCATGELRDFGERLAAYAKLPAGDPRQSVIAAHLGDAFAVQCGANLK